MSTRSRWRAPLRVRSYRALASTLARSPHPVDAFEHLVGGRGTYPWEALLRTPVGLVHVWVPAERDAREVTRAFHNGDYGSRDPHVVVEVGSRAGVSTVYFLSRSPSIRVHVWEPSPTHLAVLERNVAPFRDRCTIHPVALATATARDTTIEGIGDALRSVLRSEERIDLLRVDVAGVDDHLLSAIPQDVLPDIGEIAHVLPDGVRHDRPHGYEPDYPWRLAG